MGTLAERLFDEQYHSEGGVPAQPLSQLIVRADRAWEFDFTSSLGEVGERVEGVVIDAILDLAGHPGERQSGDGIFSGDRWRDLRAAHYPRLNADRRAPDLVIANRREDYRPRWVIEVKGNAKINAYRGYCPESPGRYRGQIHCYAHECWFPEDPELQAARRMWISPHGRFGDVITTQHVDDDPDWAESYAAQEEAAVKWVTADLNALVESLSELAVGELGAKFLSSPH